MISDAVSTLQLYFQLCSITSAVLHTCLNIFSWFCWMMALFFQTLISGETNSWSVSALLSGFEVWVQYLSVSVVMLLLISWLFIFIRAQLLLNTLNIFWISFCEPTTLKFKLSIASAFSDVLMHATLKNNTSMSPPGLSTYMMEVGYFTVWIYTLLFKM